MIRIELTTLIGKLNAVARLALEEAAALCVERQNNEVTLAHLLISLLDNPLSDLRVLLQVAGIDHVTIRQVISEQLPKGSQTGSYPAFSPMLVELLQDAWLLSSTELDQSELRSGAVLIAALMQPERYLPEALNQCFKDVNRETLRREFTTLTAGSAETEIKREGTPSSGLHSAETTALQRYTSSLTEQARNDELDPVLCRDDEINLMIDILCRRRKNNPIVVGDAGVGKSAVVEGLALRIRDGRVPDKLKGVELLSLDLGLLQAGAAVKGEFEKRLKAIIEEIRQSPHPIILFIDEAHTLIGAGNQEGGGDAANLLKPALARGELRTIGATTWKEYKKYFEKDPALSRRFQLVKLEEPSVDQAVNILRGLHPVYEAAHGVLVQDCALKAAAALSARYLAGRQLPDKAIDVLDTACARIAINLSSAPHRLSELDNRLHRIRLETELLQRQDKLGRLTDTSRFAELVEEKARVEQEFIELDRLWHQQRGAVSELIALRQSILSSEDDEHLSILKQQLAQAEERLDVLASDSRLIHPQVDETQIAMVIADWTGVPVSRMDTDELHRITNLPALLNGNIKGQPRAIECLHRHLLTARADLRRAGRPRGAFLLAGPSGVGKTETVVQIAELLYGGRQFLTTINMSEYQEKHTVSRLIGSPPGYVGYGEGGILTEAIRKMPYSVVLLDEVEKAHPDVLNLFYQAFDKGELADGEGRIIDCQNVLFFLTSNLGYQAIVDHADELDMLEERLYPELAAFFKPALLARMEVVPYLPLGEQVLSEIVEHKLDDLRQRMVQRYGAEVHYEPEVSGEILNRVTRKENGARMLEAIIDGQVLPPLAQQLLNRMASGAEVSRIRLGYGDCGFFGDVH